MLQSYPLLQRFLKCGTRIGSISSIPGLNIRTNESHIRHSDRSELGLKFHYIGEVGSLWMAMGAK